MRKALLRMVRFGWSCARVCKVFEIAPRTFDRYKKKCMENGGAPTRQATEARSKITPAGHHFLVNFVQQHNTATLKQFQMQYQKEFNVELHPSTIYRHLLQHCRVSLKRSMQYPEDRNSEETKTKRKNFIIDNIDTKKVIYQRNCVFLDEASVYATMKRNYAWSAIGQPARAEVPTIRSTSKTLLAAICSTGLVDAIIRNSKGGTTSYDFLAFVKAVAQQLKEENKGKGYYFVCDNASIHRTAHVREAIEEEGHYLLLLPPYSPFLNPIEEFFSKVKALYKQDPLFDLMEIVPESFPQYNSENDESDDEQEAIEDVDAKELLDDQIQSSPIVERLTWALSEVTIGDYQNWVNHSVTFFDKCRDRADNL